MVKALGFALPLPFLLVGEVVPARVAFSWCALVLMLGGGTRGSQFALVSPTLPDSLDVIGAGSWVIFSSEADAGEPNLSSGSHSFRLRLWFVPSEHFSGPSPKPLIWSPLIPLGPHWA